jgi:hypothetical protein
MGHPVQIFGEPFLQPGMLSSRQHGCSAQIRNRARHFHEMNRVYDTDASAGKAAVDGLRVLQVGIHPCGGIQEPGAKVAGGVLRVHPVSGDQPSRCQCRHLLAESNQGVAM